MYSSLLPRQDYLNEMVNSVNTEMDQFCQENSFTFIRNDHISTKHLFSDRKHLNMRGFKMFASSLKRAIYGAERKLRRPPPFFRRQFPQQNGPNLQHPPTRPANVRKDPQQFAFGGTQQFFNNQQPARPSYASMASRDPPGAQHLKMLIKQLQAFI